MKTLHTTVGTKVALNTQKKAISTKVKKKPETSYSLVHNFLKPLQLTLQNHSSDYWINIFSNLTKFTETPTKLVNRNTSTNKNTNKVSYSCMNNVSQNHKTTQQERKAD